MGRCNQDISLTASGLIPGDLALQRSPSSPTAMPHWWHSCRAAALFFAVKVLGDPSLGPAGTNWQGHWSTSLRVGSEQQQGLLTAPLSPQHTQLIFKGTGWLYRLLF